MSSQSRAEKSRKLERALGLVAALILLGLVFVTTADVAGRYLFGRSLRGAFELTELALVVLIFAALPLVSAANQHVTMDFIDGCLGPRRRAEWGRAVHMLTACILAGLSIAVFLKARKIADFADTTDILRIPVAPFVYLMAIATFLTAAIHLQKSLDIGRIDSDPDNQTRGGTT